MDSLALLGELILSSDPPGAMILLSFRSDHAGDSAASSVLESLRQRLSDPECWIDIQLNGLSEDDSRDLIIRLHAGAGNVEHHAADSIVHDSRGNPLFLRELVHLSLAPRDREELSASGGLRFSDMIQQRVNGLAKTARDILAILSAAGEPLTSRLLCSLLNESEANLLRPLSELMREKLVRVAGGQAAQLEPYHDQISEAAVSWLSATELRQIHSQIAAALEMEPNPDPQRLVTHHRRAGNLKSAFSSALSAIAIANQGLAFDRAAHFCAEALDTGQADQVTTAMLHRQRAEALAKAGRGYEAVKEYRAAAESPYNDRFEMHRLAAEQLLRSGHFEEGIRSFSDLLRREGVWMPKQPLASILGMIATRAFTRIRGLHWQRRHEREIPAGKLRRLDVLWIGALALSPLQPVYGTYLQARHMLAALRAGEPRRLALSSGLEAAYAALGGVADFEKGRRLLDFSQEIAASLQAPYVDAMIWAYTAFIDYLTGRVADGIEHCQRAAESFRRLGLSAAWETVTGSMMLVFFFGWSGRLREMSDLARKILEAARSRGDVYADVVVRCNTTAHLSHLAADEPERAISEITTLIPHWPKKEYDLRHFGAVFTLAECDLYAGRFLRAWSYVVGAWSPLLRSLLFRKCQILRVLLFYLRGRTALAAWIEQQHQPQLRREVMRFASRLRRTGSPWGVAFGAMLRSGICSETGNLTEALSHLDAAQRILKQQDLWLIEAAVSRRRGELEGRDGVARIDAADTFMRSQGIHRPERMARMILPHSGLVT